MLKCHKLIISHFFLSLFQKVLSFIIKKRWINYFSSFMRFAHTKLNAIKCIFECCLNRKTFLTKQKMSKNKRELKNPTYILHNGESTIQMKATILQMKWIEEKQNRQKQSKTKQLLCSFIRCVGKYLIVRVCIGWMGGSAWEGRIWYIHQLEFTSTVAVTVAIAIAIAKCNSVQYWSPILCAQHNR